MQHNEQCRNRVEKEMLANKEERYVRAEKRKLDNDEDDRDVEVHDGTGIGQTTPSRQDTRGMQSNRGRR